MASGMYFPISAIPFSILILFLFYFKGHVKTKETKIFSVLIISNLIGLLLEVLCTYASYIYNEHEQISIIIYKAYIIYIITWISTFAYYIRSISSTKIWINFKKSIRYFLMLIYYAVIITTVYFLRLDVVISEDFKTRYTTGPCVQFSYIISGIALIVILLSALLDYKNLKKKKYVPLYILLVIGGISMAIQLVLPEILLMTYIETFITVVVYFTMENPDLKMIEELNLERDRADKANKAKTDFLSSMSHEIRTPINAIDGFAQLMLEENNIDIIKEEANDIRAASQTLLEIVNGILDISKIEANKLEIINVIYEPNKVFHDIEKLIKTRVDEKNVRFITEIASDLPDYLYGDYGRIKQIVLNLLTNSCKYTKTGYIKFQVNCVKQDNVCRLIILVKDTGIGIKEENLSKLFNSFERFDKEENITIEGTGLGLAITKRLVDLMHGKILYGSRYKEGTVFAVVIDQIISDKKKEKNTESSINQKTDFKGKRVLVVDDNKVNLKVTTGILSRYNVDVTQSESGEDAIKLIDNNDYDLILMDDMMPKLSGTDTLKILKQNKSFSTPVIVLTANAIEGMRDEYIKNGFNDYLAKPIDRNELERVLNIYLN